jgi:hypothetical protein
LRTSAGKPDGETCAFKTGLMVRLIMPQCGVEQ